MSNSTESQERLYRDLIETVMVAATIAKGMGLISFDLAALRSWAEAHIHTMRVSRESQATTPADKFNDYLTSLYRHTITTKYFGDCRQGKKRASTENVVPPFDEPRARNATEDRVFFSTKTSFKIWAGKHQIDPKYLMGELEKQGYLQSIAGRLGDRLILGKGTQINTGQARCIHWDYDKIDGMLPEPEEATVAIVKS